MSGVAGVVCDLTRRGFCERAPHREILRCLPPEVKEVMSSASEAHHSIGLVMNKGEVSINAFSNAPMKLFSMGNGLGALLGTVLLLGRSDTARPRTSEFA